MCDFIGEMKNCGVIQTADGYLEKELVSQTSNEDENIKDSAPEVLGKSDICSGSLQLLEKLSNSFLSFYVEDIKKASANLQELMQNQSIVIETLQQENTRFSEVTKMHHLADMFSKLKLYYTKVQVLKKDMFTVHERTSKLKKRAMKLQQQKQKEALQKELMRDRELERDKQLAPKIATKSTSDK